MKKIFLPWRVFHNFLFYSLFILGRVYADCTSPAGVVGQLMWNSDAARVLFCNGVAWIDSSAGLQSSCAGISAGVIQYIAPLFEFCDGFNWNSMKGASNGSCAGTAAGSFAYNSIANKMQFCDGTNWFFMEGTNKMRDGSVISVGEGPTPWYISDLEKSRDGVVSGDGTVIRYGFTGNGESNQNNGRGLTVNFTSSLALRSMVFYGYSTVNMHYRIEYYDGSTWVLVRDVANYPNFTNNLNRTAIYFNLDGAISSTSWRWYISDFDHVATNFYAYELEAYL